MHNIMKIYAWAEPYVNFLLGETPPLAEMQLTDIVLLYLLTIIVYKCRQQTLTERHTT